MKTYTVLSGITSSFLLSIGLNSLAGRLDPLTARLGGEPSDDALLPATPSTFPCSRAVSAQP